MSRGIPQKRFGAAQAGDARPTHATATPDGGATHFLDRLLDPRAILARYTTLAHAVEELTRRGFTMILGFLSGMEIRRRIVMNLAIIAATVGITYLIGTITKAVWGIAV